MKSNDVYDAWKQQATQIDISDGFSDGVMSSVRSLERRKNRPRLDLETILEHITARPVVRIAVIGAGAIAGFLRVFIAAYALLSCS